MSFNPFQWLIWSVSSDSAVFSSESACCLSRSLPDVGSGLMDHFIRAKWRGHMSFGINPKHFNFSNVFPAVILKNHQKLPISNPGLYQITFDPNPQCRARRKIWDGLGRPRTHESWFSAIIWIINLSNRPALLVRICRKGKSKFLFQLSPSQTKHFVTFLMF